MRRPSFQFYPADWQGNSNLRRCTLEERGAWMEVLCLFHDSATQYGVLPWPIKQIAQAVGCKVSLLQSLVEKQVLKGADPGSMCEAFIYTPRSGRKDGPPVTLIAFQPGPLWYSSRMVKDEYIRTVRGDFSRFKGEDGEGVDGVLKASPNPSPIQTPKPHFGDGSSSSSSSSSSSVDSLLRSESPPVHEKPPIGLQVDPVLMALPCTKGKQYHVTQATLNRWKDAFQELNPMEEAKRMKFWLEENPSRQKTFQGMGKFIACWLGNACDRVKTQGQRTQPGKQPTQSPAKAQLVADYLDANPEHFEEVRDAS